MLALQLVWISYISILNSVITFVNIVITILDILIRILAVSEWARVKGRGSLGGRPVIHQLGEVCPVLSPECHQTRNCFHAPFCPPWPWSLETAMNCWFI